MGRMDVSYLIDKLNDAQREAVEYGADSPNAPPGALLVIAGAGPARPTHWRTGSPIWW